MDAWAVEAVPLLAAAGARSRAATVARDELLAQLAEPSTAGWAGRLLWYVTCELWPELTAAARSVEYEPPNRNEDEQAVGVRCVLGAANLGRDSPAVADALAAHLPAIIAGLHRLRAVAPVARARVGDTAAGALTPAVASEAVRALAELGRALPFAVLFDLLARWLPRAPGAPDITQRVPADVPANARATWRDLAHAAPAGAPLSVGSARSSLVLALRRDCNEAANYDSEAAGAAEAASRLLSLLPHALRPPAELCSQLDQWADGDARALPAGAAETWMDGAAGMVAVVPQLVSAASLGASAWKSAEADGPAVAWLACCAELASDDDATPGIDPLTSADLVAAASAVVESIAHVAGERADALRARHLDSVCRVLHDALREADAARATHRARRLACALGGYVRCLPLRALSAASGSHRLIPLLLKWSETFVDPYGRAPTLRALLHVIIHLPAPEARARPPADTHTPIAPAHGAPRSAPSSASCSAHLPITACALPPRRCAGTDLCSSTVSSPSSCYATWRRSLRCSRPSPMCTGKGHPARHAADPRRAASPRHSAGFYSHAHPAYRQDCAAHA